MTAFAFGAAVLLVLAAWLLRPAGRTPRAPADPGARPAHLAVLGEHWAALGRERAAGELDDPQHAAALGELQRRVLDETAHAEVPLQGARSMRTAGAVGLGVALFALGLYAVIGNPAGLEARPGPVAAAPAAEPEVTPEAMQAMLAALAERLEHSTGKPADDLAGWTMLARSYAALQRFPDADRAFARAIALAPGDAQLLADRADVLAVLQDQRTAGEPERLIAQALRLDPKNLKALALAGSAAFERKDFAAARSYWQRARAQAPEGSDFAAGLDQSLAAVGAADGAPAAAAPLASPAPTSAGTPPGAPPARITGRVSLAPALASRAAPTDTVFVFARAAEGSRMPLAILRRTVADLPFDFTLDDSLAMSPANALSGASRVIVGVRVSRSGNAMPQPGDLRGESAPVDPRTDRLQLLVDTVQP